MSTPTYTSFLKTQTETSSQTTSGISSYTSHTTSSNKFCFDKEPTCIKSAEQGSCQLESAVGDLVRNACPRSCGLCSTTQTTTVPDSSGTVTTATGTQTITNTSVSATKSTTSGTHTTPTFTSKSSTTTQTTATQSSKTQTTVSATAISLTKTTTTTQTQRLTLTQQKKVQTQNQQNPLLFLAPYCSHGIVCINSNHVDEITILF